MRLICSDCGSSSYLLVDGKEMTEEELAHLARSPQKIERRLSHALWCPSMDNRMGLVQARHLRDR